MSSSHTTRPGNATIFDVAEQAGVSIKTVSRVVNNEPNVREKTREKVMKAVEELAYQPSSAARGLSGKRSYTIGLVYENPNEFSYVGGLLNGALHACEKQGYTLLLEPLMLPDLDVVDAVRRFVTQTRVDGLVIPAPLCDLEDVREYLRSADVPFALITPDIPVSDAISILCEDEEATFKLTNYLIDLGHRHIGFIKGHPEHSSSGKRYSGYRRALKERGMTFSSSLVRQGYFDFKSGQEAAAKLLSLKDRPTVIMASNDDMAAGVYFEARERGLQIPEDLSLVGYDDTPLASRIWPQMTTVRQPIAEMADIAVEMLIQKIKGANSEVGEANFDCEVVIRQSTTPP